MKLVTEVQTPKRACEQVDGTKRMEWLRFCSTEREELASTSLEMERINRSYWKIVFMVLTTIVSHQTQKICKFNYLFNTYFFFTTGMLKCERD